MGKADMASKLKNLAREMKDEKSSGIKKLGDKQRSGTQKRDSSDSKGSGRKD